MICRRSSRAPVVDLLDTLRSSSAARKIEVGAAAPAEPDAIARAQLALGDRLAVDEGAVPGLAVANLVLARIGGDLGVLARDLAAAEPQVVGLSSPDGKRDVIDGDEALAEHVAYFQPGIGHRQSVSILLPRPRAAAGASTAATVATTTPAHAAQRATEPSGVFGTSQTARAMMIRIATTTGHTGRRATGGRGGTTSPDRPSPRRSDNR